MTTGVAVEDTISVTELNGGERAADPGSKIRTLYRRLKGVFVEPISEEEEDRLTDREVADIIKAYGRPLRTIWMHREF